MQRNMAANCGMDYAFMAKFLEAILSRELRFLRYTWWHTLWLDGDVLLVYHGTSTSITVFAYVTHTAVL